MESPSTTTEAYEAKSLVVFTTVPGFMSCADVISKLRAKYDGVTYDVSTTAGLAKASAARKELRDARIALDTKKPEVKREALDFCAKVESDYKAIRAAVKEYESIPDAVIKAAEERKEAEKKRIADAESERIAAIMQADRDEAIARMAAVQAAEQVLRDKEAAAERELIAKRQAALDEQKRLNDIESARLKKLADEEAAKLADERAAFEAEKKAAADAQAEIERAAREKQAAIDAENKRIADEAAAKQREEERQAAILAEQKRIEAVAKEKAAEKARKLAEAKCADASTAFKKILSICQNPPSDALAQIAIIAEGNI